MESTWILITKDPAIRVKYLKLKILRGGKRAAIAIARKLLVRRKISFKGLTIYIAGVNYLVSVYKLQHAILQQVT